MTVSGNLGANLPLGTQEFESSFWQNLLPDSWTVQVDTFLDPADGVFTTAIPLSSHLFHASDPTFDQIVRADPGNGFYSVTARFTISANDVVGSTNTTADIAFVPPASAVPGPIAGAGLPGRELWSSRLVATAEEDRLSFRRNALDFVGTGLTGSGGRSHGNVGTTQKEKLHEARECRFGAGHFFAIRSRRIAPKHSLRIEEVRRVLRPTPSLAKGMLRMEMR